jgi:hypothetical protein
MFWWSKPVSRLWVTSQEVSVAITTLRSRTHGTRTQLCLLPSWHKMLRWFQQRVMFPNKTEFILPSNINAYQFHSFLRLRFYTSLVWKEPVVDISKCCHSYWRNRVKPWQLEDKVTTHRYSNGVNKYIIPIQ